MILIGQLGLRDGGSSTGSYLTRCRREDPAAILAQQLWSLRYLITPQSGTTAGFASCAITFVTIMPAERETDKDGEPHNSWSNVPPAHPLHSLTCFGKSENKVIRLRYSRGLQCHTQVLRVIKLVCYQYELSTHQYWTSLAKFRMVIFQDFDVFVLQVRERDRKSSCERLQSNIAFSFHSWRLQQNCNNYTEKYWCN